MSLPQIQRRGLQQQQVQQPNIQGLLEMNSNLEVPENEKIRQRNPKNLQSKGMTEIFGGRSIVENPTQSATALVMKRPGSRPDTGSKQRLQVKQTVSQPYQQQNIDFLDQPTSDPSGGQQQQQQRGGGGTFNMVGMTNSVDPFAQLNFNGFDTTAQRGGLPLRLQPEQQQQQSQPPQQIQYAKSLKQPITSSLNSYNPGVDRMINLFESQDIEFREKIVNQERVVTMLIEQLNNVERNQQGELRKQRMQLDSEREYRVKLETNLRFLQDQYSQLNHDLQNRVEILDSKLLKEDRSKTEMRDKLILTEQNQKEILFFIRNMQKSETSEILQLRGIMQDKMTEEQGALQKEREKSKALFMEVVRLGETQSRQNETFNDLQGQFESRIAILEAQLNAGQRSVNQIAQKGDQGMTYISDWNEKLERRMQQSEGNILALNKEQIKDREMVAQLQAYHQRMSEDVKIILNTLQADFDNKLDTKVSEIVSRVVMEHEDRVRSHEEMKVNFEMRERISSEKSNYEREEMRERYSALDALMRTEFQRKDESIKSLQAILENQVKGLQNALKFEEQSRNQQEILFRNEILSIQETFAREYDVFKNQQSNITEKITEMMKIEIQTRLSSDVDLKNLTSAIATDIVSDVNSVKDTMEIQYKKILDEIRESRLEGSQRAEQVSRYVDDEVKKVVDVFSKKHEKTKSMFTKLAEQFKNHLINTDVNRKDVEKRIVSLEKQQEDLRVETYKLVGDAQKAFESRLLEEKMNLELSIETLTKGLDDKITKVEAESKKDVEFLQQAIENTRDMFNNRVNNLQKSMEQFHQLLENSLDGLKETLEEVKSNLADYKESMNTQFNEFKEKVEVQVQELSENIRSLAEQVHQDVTKLQADVEAANEALSGFSKYISQKITELAKHVKDIEEQTNEKIHDLQLQAFNQLELINSTLETIDTTHEEVKREMRDRQVEQLLDAMMMKAETTNLKQEIAELFDLMNTQHQDMKVAHTHFEGEFAKIAGEIDVLKTELFYELSEASDRKLQKLLENIRNDAQTLWQNNVQLADSDFKTIDALRDNQNGLLTQLNEILITQDNYNKPKLKTRK